jgi:ribosomal protein L37AE/L43A
MAEQGTLDPSHRFDCPRCGQEVLDRLYGPCEDCRVHLRATFAGEARTVQPEAYLPKVNVTPNAVALRDD